MEKAAKSKGDFASPRRPADFRQRPESRAGNFSLPVLFQGEASLAPLFDGVLPPFCKADSQRGGMI